MVGVLGISPDVVMYFYDPSIFPYQDIYCTYNACKKYIPSLSYEVGRINEHDYDDIFRTVTTYIENWDAGDELFIDLTGGSELAVIAAYDAGRAAGCHIYFTDVVRNSVINLTSKAEQYRSLPFEVEDMIAASGGKMLSCTDDQYLQKNRGALSHMARFILENNAAWLRTCQYFQKHNIELRQSDSLHFSGRFDRAKSENRSVPDMNFLYEFSHQRLITNLGESGGRISFDYRDNRMLDYISSFGVWLELFTYYHMLDISGVHDVHTSIKIDWNALDDADVIGNEIDVTAMYGCRPVLISCKQSAGAVTAATLNEIYVVARRIGGKYAIPVLVTYSQMRQKHQGIYLKAREMGIHMMDYDDIMSDRFSERLQKKISGSLK